jgi:hypothetical protein
MGSLKVLSGIFFISHFTPLIYPPTPFVLGNEPPMNFVGKYFPIKDFGDVKNIRLLTTKNIRGNRQHSENDLYTGLVVY